MPDPPVNPFNITKAVDLSDEEINTYFVDIGYAHMANPSSAMPMLIRGGKGSGKTHVMRYYSYPLQKIRGRPDFVSSIQREGYIGIYSRCGGLNASRFTGKGQSREVWDTLFAYYIDLWLGQLVLQTVSDFTKAAGIDARREREAVAACTQLFDEAVLPETGTFLELADALHSLQRLLDTEINNVAMTRTMNVRIAASPGRLVFGIPRILKGTVEPCKDLLTVYLLDEYENLQEEQQKYFNTLVREKEPPTTFKIGGRIYGFKTFKTYSADEEIKEGSEYEVLLLDHSLRASKEYPQFARRLCARRLVASGYAPPGSDLEPLLSTLDDTFEVSPSTPLFDAETAFVLDKYEGRERPYCAKLREKLKLGYAGDMAPGIASDADISEVLQLLTRPQRPLLEKINVFLFYQQWRHSSDLVRTAQAIAEQCDAYLEGRRAEDYKSALQHYKVDMLAQLLRECDQKQRYIGLETFIDMAEGLPRNLLIVLKLIFKWAIFNGDRPFQRSGISVSSQQAGVRQAADWFFADARMPGDDGQAIRDSISRLARLFREVRFSDKPSECSLCAFSADVSSCSGEARRIINLAENWSLLINVTGGQRDRNSLRVDEKYQLNRILAPRWDLPISRRGVLALTAREVNALFDASCSKEFDDIVSDRVSRMTAPAFGRKGRSQSEEAQQPQLPLS